MSELKAILAAIEEEARNSPFDVDREVYKRADRPWEAPILTAGNVRASLCMFARDLGHEEVLRGQPLIGAAGRRVRKAIFDRMADDKHADPPFYSAAMKYVLFTNTVPYKPVGNVEYDRATKSRFRPFIEDLLVNLWEGTDLIPMGEGAFKWFAPYGAEREVVNFWDDRERRFTDTLTVTVPAIVGEKRTEKKIVLAPVPHPSPRSPFMVEFPAILEARLEQLLPKAAAE